MTVTTQPSAVPSISSAPPSSSGLATAEPASAQPTSMPSEPPTNPPSALPSESATPPTDTPAPATATPTAEATANVIGQQNGLIVDWNEVADSGIASAVTFNAVASANGTLVAIGEAGQDFQSRVWVSKGGRSWTEADFPDSDSFQVQLSSVAAGGPGFVIVGSDYSAPAGVVWLSSDGQSWERIDADAFTDQSLSKVGMAGGRLVAFSDEGGVFTSADGRNWDPSADASAQTVAAGILALGGDGSTLWAFSRDTDEPRENRQQIEVWRSDDGQAWTQIGTIEGSNGASGAWAAGGPGGFVVISNAYLHDTSVWQAFYSADGSTWEPAEQNPTDITDVLSTAAGFVAVGHYNTGTGCALIETDDVGVTWTSVDGITWRHMPEKGWNGREVNVVVQSGTTLVGMGTDWNRFYDNKDAGTLWAFDLPIAAEDLAPAPSTTPEPTSAPGCGD